MLSTLDHHLERARIEEIADQHARGVAEQRVGGLAAAAQLGFVDDVVVQQRRGVDELDDRRQLVVMRARGSRRRAATAARSAGRRRLPPPPMMYSAIWRISTTSESQAARG